MPRFLGPIVCVFLLAAPCGRPCRGDDASIAGEAKVLREALAPVAIGTDERFDLFKANGGLRPEVLAPKDFRSLVVGSSVSFQSLRTGLSRDDTVVTAMWSVQASFEGALDDASKRMTDELRRMGFSPVKDESLPPFEQRQLSQVQGRAREMLSYCRQVGECREFVIIPLVDRPARPGSSVEMGLIWYVTAPRPRAPLTFRQVFEAFPMLKPPRVDQELLDAADKGTFQRIETAQETAPRPTVRRPAGLSPRGEWSLQVTSDIRSEVKDAAASVGFVQLPADSRQVANAESVRWERDNQSEGLSMLFLNGSMGDKITNLTGLLRPFPRPRPQ